jgi:hypothetical protein
MDIQVSPSALVVSFASSSGGGSSNSSGGGAGSASGSDSGSGSGNVNGSSSGLSEQAQSVHVSGFAHPLNRESVQAKMSKKKGTLTVTLHYQQT